jgi:hypothetical protein
MRKRARARAEDKMRESHCGLLTLMGSVTLSRAVDKSEIFNTIFTQFDGIWCHTLFAIVKM